MRITVIAVDPEDVCLVRGTSAFGWRGKFGCELVVGDVVFIPAPGREDNLRRGNNINVEPGYEEITEFSLVDSAANGHSMAPLEAPRDYLVCGTVVQCAPLGNVQVSVRGLLFTLERGELNGCNPSEGDAVQFKVHGLSFWDKE